MVKATPTKSRAPFYGILLLLVVAGAGGIFYSVTGGKPKPIELPKGTPLPKAEGYLRGNPDAAITIIEFADFECPGCGQFATVTEPDIRTRIVDAGLANFRYYDFPLSIHANTMAASLAASCAADQGKFWEMHDVIFAGQPDWNTQQTSNPRKFFDKYAGALGLDMKVYAQCFDSQKNLPRIEANRNAGNERGVASTPTLLIGNKLYSGMMGYDAIKAVVDSMRLAAGVAPVAPPTTSDMTPKTDVKIGGPKKP